MLRKHFMMSGLEKPDYVITYVADLKVPFIGGEETKNLTMWETGTESEPLAEFKVISDTYINGYGKWAIKTSNPTAYYGLILDSYNNTYYADSGSIGNITGIIFPEGITEIGGLLLNNNNNLIDVKLPSTLTTIGNNTFTNSKITKLILPKNILNIGDDNFKNCTNLNEIIVESIIPPTITSKLIDNEFDYEILVPSVTKYCETLWGQYKLNKNHMAVVSLNDVGLTFLFNRTIASTNSSNNLYYLDFYVSPTQLIKITDNTYKWVDGVILELPNSIEEISANAFKNLQSSIHDVQLVLNDKLKHIGENAFNIVLSKIRYMGTIDEWLKIKFDNAYSNPISRLSGDFYIKNTVLLSIEIPTNITEILNFTFYNLKNATEIKIHNNIKKVGIDAFKKISNTAQVIYTGTLNEWLLIDFLSYEANPATFTNCIYINDEIPKLLYISKTDTINVNALIGLSDLETIVVEEGHPLYDSRENCNAIIETATNTLIKGCKNTVIPNSVTTIGPRAFYGVRGLETLIIDDNITYIDSYAFYKCADLKSLTLGKNAALYGDPFTDCTLDTLTIKTDNPCDLYPFYNSSTVVTWDGVCTEESHITDASKFFKNVGHLILGPNITYIPQLCSTDKYTTVYLSTIQFLGNVTTIGSNAFYKSKIEEITLPESVSYIGKYAFAYCSNLTSITLPESVSYIGEHAFNHCSSLTEINIPNNVTELNEGTFWYCSKLQSITFGKNVTVINDEVLYSNKVDIIVKYNGTLEDWCNINFIGRITGNNSQLQVYNDGWIEVAGDLVIPDGVTSIGNYAFYGLLSITSVTIPESVTYIGTNSFYNCINIQTINCLTENVTYCYGAFNSSSWYKNQPDGMVYLSDKIIYRYKGTLPENSELIIPEGVVYVCPVAFSLLPISKVTIPQTVTIITPSMFSGCTKLQSVILQDNIEQIQNSAFKGCTSLTSFNVPANVTILGPYVFNSCSKLSNVVLSENLTSIGESAFYNCSSLPSITIPNSVTSIGRYAFYGCSSLPSVTIPNSVTTIGERAFSDCSGLTAITIPNSVTSIGTWAFSDCSSLASVTIGNSVTSIGSQAFSGCTSLTSVTIGNSVTSIGYYAFSGCTSLTSVTIPNSVTSIGEYAFLDCTSLTSVVIPNSVTSIGGYAFYYCSSLTSIVIPDGVTSIGKGAFRGCSSLTSVSFGNGLTELPLVFSRTSNILYIEIGKNIKHIKSLWIDDYSASSVKTVSYLGTLEDFCNLDVEDSFSDYNYDLIIDGQSITELIIPETIVEIKPYLFNNIQNLQTVVFHDNVTSISRNNFNYCSITTINWPQNIITVDKSCFHGLYLLENLIIPDNIVWKGNTNFSSPSYSKLTTAKIHLNSIETPILLPDTIKNIYYYGDEQQFYIKGVLKNNVNVYLNDELIEVTDGLSVSEGISSINLSIPDTITTLKLPHSIEFINACDFKNVVNIEYNGTLLEWKSLLKPSNHTYYPYYQYTIACTDGTFKKQVGSDTYIEVNN